MTDPAGEPPPTESPSGSEPPSRPVARVAGIVAYVADIVILVTLIAQFLVGGLSGGQALLEGMLAIAIFLLAAGLSQYGGGVQSQYLVAFAGMYSLIAAVLLVLAAFDPGPERTNTGAQLLVILLIAGAAVAMSVVTAQVANLPTRRLSIPYIGVALFLTIVATLVVVGVDGSTLFGADRLVTLSRLLVALVATGLAIAWLLMMGNPSRPRRLRQG